MTHIRLAAAFLTLLWFTGTPAFSQDPSSTASLVTGIERDINRYQWIVGGNLSTSVGAWAISAENRFVSDALILFQNRLSFRDANRARVSAVRNISQTADLRVGGTSNWYSLSRVYNQMLYAGSRLGRDTYWVEPRLGYSIDARPGVGANPGSTPIRTDAGPAGGFLAHIATETPDNWSGVVDLGGSYERISPRQQHKLYANGITSARFENAQLSGNVAVVTTRRDAYQATSFLNRDNAISESIEATTSDTLAVATSFSAPVFGPLTLDGTLDFGANARRVRNPNPSEETLFFETDFSRRNLDATLNLVYTRGSNTARITFHGGVEEEQRTLSNRDRLPPVQATQKANLLRQADFDRGFYALSGFFRTGIGRRFVATGDATINLLRHDTPDINPDDRDERFARGQIGLRGIVNEYLSADVQVFATQYETVYLKAVRSAENNVQRSLRLRPVINWTPSRDTRVRVGSEIRATYTVDDFVLGGRRPRDQSARELQYDVDGQHNFGGGLMLRFSGEQSELRLGRFFADSFSEIPFDTLQTRSGWIRLSTGGRATAELGLRVFYRRDFNQSTRVQYARVDADGNPIVDANGDPIFTTITRPGRERIAQIGPTCSITWQATAGATIRIDGWLTFQRISRRLYGTLPDGEREQILEAARSGVRTTIPNMTMTVSWRI
ncbi:MAG: hypothetical protein KDD65_18135 [Bacteroidetes bacterium]|nr:hypothetical protein [Bacteroidota bacterium]